MKTLSRTSQDANPASPLARWRAESLRAITLAKSNSASTLRERTIEGLHEALLKKVKSLPHITPDTPILDIGCGSGAWMNRLAANGFAVLHGVDGDTEQFAGERGTCSAVSLDTDVDLGLGDRKFGLITSIELIEHLENPGTLFFHVARHLSDDGVFLMTTPNIHSLPCRLRFLLTGKLKDFDSKGDQTHIYPVLLTSLQRILP
ncbi:MAG TPA: class I SAM-dependent methyltransferase, partial [Candidatus Binataceae bacterium]|nr:class I SAM-dependent methyltransferase [Candidatus Binataceae bacterium]